jgi:hypothetical protein
MMTEDIIKTKENIEIVMTVSEELNKIMNGNKTHKETILNGNMSIIKVQGQYKEQIADLIKLENQ